MSKRQNRYAIVVLSHSSYADIWPILIASYKKYFETQLFDFYITTDEYVDCDITNSQFGLLLYPKEVSWSDALFLSIKDISYDKIIFSFDDLILDAPVDCESLIKLLDKDQSNYLKLICSHVKFYDRFLRRGETFEISQHDSYRGSLVFTALDRQLIEYLGSIDELRQLSPWEFERRVNDFLPNCFLYTAVRCNYFSFQNLVIKGKVNGVSAARIKYLEGLSIDTNRPLLSTCDSMVYYIKLLLFTTVKYFLPSQMFARLRKAKQSVVRDLRDLPKKSGAEK